MTLPKKDETLSAEEAERLAASFTPLWAEPARTDSLPPPQHADTSLNAVGTAAASTAAVDAALVATPLASAGSATAAAGLPSYGSVSTGMMPVQAAAQPYSDHQGAAYDKTPVLYQGALPETTVTDELPLENIEPELARTIKLEQPIPDIFRLN